jgi:hypothetical protein
MEKPNSKRIGKWEKKRQITQTQRPTTVYHLKHDGAPSTWSSSCLSRLQHPDCPPLLVSVISFYKCRVGWWRGAGHTGQPTYYSVLTIWSPAEGIDPPELNWRHTVIPLYCMSLPGCPTAPRKLKFDSQTVWMARTSKSDEKSSARVKTQGWPWTCLPCKYSHTPDNEVPGLRVLHTTRPLVWARTRSRFRQRAIVATRSATDNKVFGFVMWNKTSLTGTKAWSPGHHLHLWNKILKTEVLACSRGRLIVRKDISGFFFGIVQKIMNHNAVICDVFFFATC